MYLSYNHWRPHLASLTPAQSNATSTVLVQWTSRLAVETGTALMVVLVSLDALAIIFIPPSAHGRREASA